MEISQGYWSLEKGFIEPGNYMDKRIGFYACGEIAPQKTTKVPMLHPQTMTMIALFER